MSNLSKIDEREIIQALESQDLGEAWEAYKSYNNIFFSDLKQEKEALLMMRANNLNPLKKECFLVPMGGKPTLVVAYQTLLKRAYESGYDSKDIEFTERVVESFTVDEKGQKWIKGEDLECKATITTSKDKSYSFVGTFSQYVGKKADGSITQMWKNKPVLMLRKCVLSGLFRTLPNAGLQSMPYTKDEMNSEPVEASVTSIVKEQDDFMNLASVFVNRVSELQISLDLTSEEAEQWTEEFWACGDIESLKAKGNDLKLFLDSKKIHDEQFQKDLGLTVNDNSQAVRAFDES